MYSSSGQVPQYKHTLNLYSDITVKSVCIRNDKIHVYTESITVSLYRCAMDPNKVCIMHVSSITVPMNVCRLVTTKCDTGDVYRPH